VQHAVKVGRAELAISEGRLVRHILRMRSWSPERTAHAREAAERRLQGKHPRKRDAAVYLAAGGKDVGNG
jgi:hypothetical protein